MRDCEYYQMNLSAMLDGELHGTELSETVKHLSECSNCMREFERFQKLQVKVDEVYQPEPLRQGLWMDIQAKSQSERGQKHKSKAKILSFKSPWVRIISAAALFLIIFGLGYYFGKPSTAIIQNNTPIVLASSAGEMGEDRFMQITRELLTSDRKYHLQMYLILRALVSEDLEGDYDLPTIGESSEGTSGENQDKIHF